MALEYQNFATLGVNLNRQKYGPLDVSSVFTSTADLTYYRTKGTIKEGVSEYWYKNETENVTPYPYEGQIVSLVENGEVSVFKLVANGDVFDAVELGGGGIGYEPIEIEWVKNNIEIAENGSSVGGVIFTWEIKNDEMLDTLTLGDYVLTETEIANKTATRTVNITGSKTWTLKATDKNGSVSLLPTFITFYNGVYYGVINNSSTINSTLINNLVSTGQITKVLQGSPSLKFTATANDGQVFFYALPSSYKKPSFKDAETNLSAGMRLAKERMSFTNATNNHTEYYNIWLSEQTGLGKMTIEVSEVE